MARGRLYFLVGSVPSERARLLVKRSRVEVDVERIETGSDLAELYKTRGISELPFLVLDGRNYFGLEEIRRCVNPHFYANLEIRQTSLVTSRFISRDNL